MLKRPDYQIIGKSFAMNVSSNHLKTIFAMRIYVIILPLFSKVNNRQES